MKVAVIGASNKPDRYSYKAVMLLRDKGHEVFPVHPILKDVEGIKVFNSFRSIPEAIDVVTLYVGPSNQDELGDEILQKKPNRVIFNPGTENAQLIAQLREAGIEVLEACTLVMLTTGQF